MRSTIAAIVTCATMTALAVAWPVGSAPPVVAGGQLRPGTVKELATGKLLVAARGLLDPNFRETVILLAEHSTDGAMGLVVNRRTDVPLSRVFPESKSASASSGHLFVGGPVAPEGVVALLRTTTPNAEGRLVFDDVYMIATREALDATLSAGTGHSRFRVYLGYSGWGPGQLERETLAGSWHVFRAESASIFDSEPDTLWQRQIRRTEERMARLRLPASARQAQPD